MLFSSVVQGFVFIMVNSTCENSDHRNCHYVTAYTSASSTPLWLKSTTLQDSMKQAQLTVGGKKVYVHGAYYRQTDRHYTTTITTLLLYYKIPESIHRIYTEADHRENQHPLRNDLKLDLHYPSRRIIIKLF